MNTLRRKPRLKPALAWLFILLPAFCGILVLYACDFPGSPPGEEGYLTINLSGAPADSSRAVISNAAVAGLEYEITFTGPGGIVTTEVVPPGSGSTTLTLTPGTWSIVAEAYDYPLSVKTLVGTGTASVTLARGQAITVPISMTVDSAYEGTLTTIYIHNEAELRRIGTDFAITTTMNFILENDITINDPWTPIGDDTTPFAAVFDGNGHTITVSSGFSAAALTGKYLGLLGKTLGGTIKNLTIVYEPLTVASTYTGTSPDNKVWLGGAVAYAADMSFQKVRVRGNITCNAAADIVNIGGVAGSMEGNTNQDAISACSFEGTLTGTGPEVTAGGILGRHIGGTSYTGGLTDSFTAGTVSVTSTTGAAAAGGIAGSGPCNIADCYSKAAVSAASAPAGGAVAGGIIGTLDSGPSSMVNKCYALGQVGITVGSSTNAAGGIAGINSTGAAIQNCVALLAGIFGSSTDVGLVIGYSLGSSPTNYAASDIPSSRGIGGTHVIDGTAGGPRSDFQGGANEPKYTALSWTFASVDDWKWWTDEAAYPYPIRDWQTAPPQP